MLGSRSSSAVAVGVPLTEQLHDTSKKLIEATKYTHTHHIPLSQVTVEQRSRVMNVTQKVRTGVLFMVDLAGSERAAITQVRC